jgi:ATP-dependent RNA helicase DeaD
MAEDSVWFSAAIGRKKNAEARWLLPMLCRRGSIKKEDIGAIRVLDTTTEFEISARVASRFAARIRRPDKEDSIRIEALAGAPPREEARAPEWTPKPHGKTARPPDGAGFDKKARYDTKKSHRDRPAHPGKPRHENEAPAKVAFAKKKKKKFRD